MMDISHTVPVIQCECSCLGRCLRRTDPVSPERRRCHLCVRTWQCWAFGFPWPRCRSHCGSVSLNPGPFPGRGHSSWTQIWKCLFPGMVREKNRETKKRGKVVKSACRWIGLDRDGTEKWEKDWRTQGKGERNIVRKINEGEKEMWKGIDRKVDTLIEARRYGDTEE